MIYKPLTGAKLQQIQACMRYVHCVMIDEISMVSNLTLLHVHLRLTEIFGFKGEITIGLVHKMSLFLVIYYNYPQ